MFSKRFLRRPLIGAALIGAAVVASGVAIAGTAAIGARHAVPSSIETVSACVHNGNSQLRLVSDPGACGSDTAVSWSATIGSLLSGQVGDVYTINNEAHVGPEITGGGTFVRVLHLSLPPGSYTLSAKTELGAAPGGDPFEAEGFCFLAALDVQSNTQSQLDESSMRLTSPEPVITLPLQAVATFSGPTVVNLDCINATGELSGPKVSLFAQNAVLTAVVVGKVNVQH